MTVAGNIAFPLEMRDMPGAEIRRRVEAVLKLVELPGFEDRYPRQLSGGQQQRVALARAIVFEPTLLLMDEPLGALDKKLREQMQIEIKHLHKRLGISIIYVTHDQDEALVMSDRIGVFNRGRLEQIGPAEELYERPRHAFRCGFHRRDQHVVGTVGRRKPATRCSKRPNGPLAGRAQARWPRERPRCFRFGPSGSGSTAQDAAAAGRNRLTGRIAETIYMGRGRKYVVETASWPHTHGCPAGGRRPGQHVRHSAGDLVAALFAPEDAVIIPETRIGAAWLFSKTTGSSLAL